MSSGSGRFFRDNAFLIAAVSLPIAVVVLFVLMSAVPRWTVPPPAYDVLLRTSAYDQAPPGFSMDFEVRDERLHVTVREAPANTYPYRAHLWLFDHATMNVRQVQIEVPPLLPGEKTRTVAIAALAGRRVLTQAKAPDGYEVQNRDHGGAGFVGELFGMGRYNSAVSLVNRGRIVKVAMPTPYEHQPPFFVGWLIDEGTR
jgi:hypothetical protein